MTALVLTEGSRFDARAFYAFLTAQPDLSPKSFPDYVRLCAALPETRTLKVLRGDLKRAGFDPARCADPIWWRERSESGFKPFAAADYAKVRAAFVRAGREAELLLP